LRFRDCETEAADLSPDHALALRAGAYRDANLPERSAIRLRFVNA
jgi:hypothetical protein